MSMDLNGKIPERLFSILKCGSEIERNIGILLSTFDSKGFPHFAMLSPFQVIITQNGDFLISLYSSSETTVNLTERKMATLAIVLPPSAFYISVEFSTSSNDVLDECIPDHVVFCGKLKRILEDYSGDAPITSTIRFDDRNVLDRYAGEKMMLCQMIGESQN